MLFHKRGPRVEAEAAALAAARHPGVVELVGLQEGVLQTLMLDALSVAELGPLPADEVAGVAAAVGTTLADLHELGVVHGGVEASHVLMCADGRLVLCSLGRGGAPPDDVAALGRMVADLLAAIPGLAAPTTAGLEAPEAHRADAPSGADATVDAPTRTRARSRLRQTRPGPLRRGPGRRPGRARRGRLGAMLAPPAAPALVALVTEATAPDPARRPSARAFATAVHQRVPTARLPGLPRRPLLPLPPAPSPMARRLLRARPPAARTLLWGLAAVAVVAGTLALAALAPWVRPDREPPTPTAGAQANQRRPAAAVTPTPTSRAAPVAMRVWPPDALHFSDGVLTIDGARYALGQPGDALAAGDWACTGRRTLALLRPGTGELFAFDGWAEAGQDLPARPVGRVPGGTGIRAVDTDGDGCDDLEVSRHGKPPLHLEIRS